MTFDEVLIKYSRPDGAKILGTTVPTLQRWIKNGEYPSYVDLILKLRKEIEDLKDQLETESTSNNDTRHKIKRFVDAQKDLFELVEN